jgi:hypothetical protein
MAYLAHISGGSRPRSGRPMALCFLSGAGLRWFGACSWGNCSLQGQEAKVVTEKARVPKPSVVQGSPSKPHLPEVLAPCNISILEPNLKTHGP